MKVVQQPGMSSAELAVYIGPERQIVMNTDLLNLHVMDGVTPGGIVFLNEDQAALYALRYFNAVVQYSAGEEFAAGDVGAFIRLTATDDYTMMHLSDADVGQPVTVFAAAVGVNLLCNGVDLFVDHNTDSATLALTQYETVVVVKQDTARWRVVSRY